MFVLNLSNSPFPGSWEETILAGTSVPSILAVSCWKALTYISWHWPEDTSVFPVCDEALMWKPCSGSRKLWLENRTDLFWEIKAIQAQISTCCVAGTYQELALWTEFWIKYTLVFHVTAATQGVEPAFNGLDSKRHSIQKWHSLAVAILTCRSSSTMWRQKPEHMTTAAKVHESPN